MIPDTPDDVVHPLIQPPAWGAITEQYIFENTMFATPAGHIYTLPGKVIRENGAKDKGAFDRFGEQVIGGYQRDIGSRQQHHRPLGNRLLIIGERILENLGGEQGHGVEINLAHAGNAKTLRPSSATLISKRG